MASDIIARALAAKALAEISGMGGGIKFKGTVPTEADLPVSGNQNGDMYITEDTGTQHIWNVNDEFPEGHWVSVSPKIDLTAYLRKDELASNIGDSTQTAMTQAAVTSALNELDTEFNEKLESKADKADVREIYVQDYEPEEASDGAIWIDTNGELPSFEEVQY